VTEVKTSTPAHALALNDLSVPLDDNNSGSSNSAGSNNSGSSVTASAVAANAKTTAQNMLAAAPSSGSSLNAALRYPETVLDFNR